MVKKVDERISSVVRKTNETEIFVKVNLDGSGYNKIKTGLPFFDSFLRILIIGSKDAITPALERSSYENPPVIIYPWHSLIKFGFEFQRTSTGFIFTLLIARNVSLSVFDPGNWITPMFIVI